MVINKYVAKLPCNLSLIACFVTLVLQGSVATYVGLLITSSLQIYKESSSEEKLESRLRFDRIMAMSFWSHDFWPTMYDNKNQCHNCKQHEWFSCNTTHWSQSLRCAQVINCKGYVVSRQDTNRNNTKCMLSVRRHYITTPVTPCSTEHFLKCFSTVILRLYSRSPS